MAVNLSHLLQKPRKEIEKPKPLPNGDYPGVVKGFEYREAKTKDGHASGIVRFNVQLTDWPEDFDEDQKLTDDNGNVVSPKRLLPKDIWLKNNEGQEDLWPLESFLRSLGIESESLEEGIPLAVGKTVLATVKQTANKETGEMEYTNLGKVVGTEG